MADGFTRDKFAWLDQIAADHGVSSTAFRVAYALATKYLSREKGCAWPSQATLAGVVGIKRRSLQSALYELRDRGHLHIDENHGRLQSNEYHPIIHNAQKTAQPKARKTAHSKSNSADLRTIRRGKLRTGSAESCALIPLSEPIEEPIERYTPRRSNLFGEEQARKKNEYDAAEERGEVQGHGGQGKRDIPNENIPSAADIASFDKFWNLYPKRVGRGHAIKAYRRIIKAGEATPEQLEAGAIRYAAEREGKDSQYTKNPATWLNAQCWTDEPAASHQSGDRPRIGAMSAVAGIVDHFLEENGNE